MRFLAFISLVLCCGCVQELPVPLRPVRLRIVTYNIHHGAGVGGAIDATHAASVVGMLSPDIVALQEVDRNTERSGADQPEEFAQATGMSSTFGATMEFQGGQFGNAILSRDQPIRSSVHALPGSTDREPRSVLRADFLTDIDEYTVLCTHLDHGEDSSDRLAAVDAIAELVRADPERPMILVGDLNATRNSFTLASLESDWLPACEPVGFATYPAEAPVKQLDHVLVRPAHRWNLITCSVPEESLASDHRPLLVVLELLPPR